MITPLRLLMAYACALAISSTLPSTATAAGAPFDLPKQFKAEFEGQMMGQKTAFTLYSGGEDKQRAEMTAHGMTTIIRKDQQKIYMLMAAQKQVMEMPYNPAMAAKMNGFANDKDTTWERQGSETVRGIDCEKWQVANAKGDRMLYWMKADHTPVRMLSLKDNAQVEVLSFTIGAQDASLFEPPADWTRTAMPAMPAGMAGQ